MTEPWDHAPDAAILADLLNAIGNSSKVEANCPSDLTLILEVILSTLFTTILPF